LKLAVPGLGFFAVEAKWDSDLGPAQGVGGTSTQLDMRVAQVDARGLSRNSSGVLVITPPPALYHPGGNPQSVFRRYFVQSGGGYAPSPLARQLRAEVEVITWTEVLDLVRSIAGLDEVVRYLKWRLDILQHGWSKYAIP
jgi:hypothetical protein